MLEAAARPSLLKPSGAQPEGSRRLLEPMMRNGPPGRLGHHFGGLTGAQ